MLAAPPGLLGLGGRAVAGTSAGGRLRTPTVRSSRDGTLSVRLVARQATVELGAASYRASIWASASAPNRCSNTTAPSGAKSHDSVTSVPPATGVNAYPHRVRVASRTNANSRPGSAATTSERVSQVRSGSSFRPVKCAPTVGPSPSSHQQAVHTGLHSPIRVTSDTMA